MLWICVFGTFGAHGTYVAFPNSTAWVVWGTLVLLLKCCHLMSFVSFVQCCETLTEVWVSASRRETLKWDIAQSHKCTWRFTGIINGYLQRFTAIWRCNGMCASTSKKCYYVSRLLVLSACQPWYLCRGLRNKDRSSSTCLICWSTNDCITSTLQEDLEWHEVSFETLVKA